jgi:hypothetical protein
MLATLTDSTNGAPSDLRPRSLPGILGGVLAAFMFLLAARGFLVPAEAAHGFGIDIEAPADLFYLHIKAGRDLGWGLLFAGLLFLRQRAPLRVAVAAATACPLVDCVASILDPRGHVGYALAVHGSAAVFGVVLVALLRPRRQSNL